MSKRRSAIPSPWGTGVVLLLGMAVVAVAEQPDQHDFFEQRIRPLLAQSCVKCHGAKEQSGNLRLDSRQALLRGGENGTAIVPGKPDESLLISVVRRTGELAMPPDTALSPTQVEALARWVELGSPWPEPSVLSFQDDTPHWAFLPVKEPPVPTVDDNDWVQTPIDAFVLARLQEHQLTPSPAADRRTLIRRATFDLLGLPPTADEVESFAGDDDPRAWERLIDRLLDSPHYGEKWGRHWLDVARYSDTKGYVYAREERFWVHAGAYRDWIVQALNRDLPYDRFLLLQIAADQIETSQSDLAAMGFLTIGRRFLGVTHEIIDDRIDVVTRGTMGLTVACARCHDHKYDPIPTRDYYSVYGVFRNCIERLVPLDTANNGDTASNKDSDFRRGLEERTRKLNETMARHRADAAARVRSRVQDYLIAQLELEKYPEEGFDQILVDSDLMPAFVRQWRDHLARAADHSDPVFTAWRRFQAIEPERFAEQAPKISLELQVAPVVQVDSRIAAAFVAPPTSMHEVAIRYGEVFSEADRQFRSRANQDGINASADDPLLRVLYGPHAPCEVPDEPIVNTELFFPTDECEELWKLRGEVDRWLINSAQSPPQALILVDRETMTDTHVLLRGNPSLPGEPAPRQFLAAIAGDDRQPFQHGSGRLELARAIVAPSNPLTPRVAVNRVWMHHFGSGLVRTPSDFGRRAEPPSHPELLDWLAAHFVAEGWSLKKLHRLIMRSSVYQQSSFGPDDPSELARAEQLDPENRWLWRMNTARLTFEQLRDAALAVTGDLDADVGGRAVDLFGSQRRTLYGQIDRQFFPTLLRVFDFANPDLHIPTRSETVVPQQALFFMNHPFLVRRSIALARRCTVSGGPDSDQRRVREMYRTVYQREPTSEQLDDAVQWVRRAIQEDLTPSPRQVTEWQYGFGEYHPEQEGLIGFQSLPYFDGKAWQGGPKWPDAELGWVQLTAAGGHAGNDKQHAAVRRWTAPRTMRIKIESALVHDAQSGDGVRGFLVSNRQGLLHSAEVHMRAERFDVEALEVEAGETVDFVVDLRDNLNHEEYQWEVSMVELPDEVRTEPSSWNSRHDFSGTPTVRLGPWEQLAQVLLSANEFLFVD